MNKQEQMAEIVKEVEALKKSPLYKYRKENNYIPVVGEGSLSAKIFFVGEAPGKNEAETGKPFCGRSGKFLDEMLAHVSLDRKKVYITSVVKDRPQDNRDPIQKEIDLYGPYLDRQFEIIKPKVIVLLGRISMKYVFEKVGMGNKLENISIMHGKVYEARLPYGKVKLIPLYHPAAALYNPKMRELLFKDFEILGVSR